MYLELPTYWYSYLFSHVDQDLHCSTNLLHLLFSHLMGVSSNCSFSLAIAHCDIFCVWHAPCIWKHCLSTWSRALRDRSERFCWLTSREYPLNASTATITSSLAAVSATRFVSSSELTRNGVKVTPCVLIPPRMYWLCQVQLFNESNGSVKFSKPGYHETCVNWLCNWSLTFWRFW